MRSGVELEQLARFVSRSGITVERLTEDGSDDDRAETNEHREGDQHHDDDDCADQRGYFFLRVGFFAVFCLPAARLCPDRAAPPTGT